MTRRFEVDVIVESAPPVIDPGNAARLLRQLAGRLAVPHMSVGLLLSDDARMKELNHRFCGKNRSTDVLSFPASDEGLPIGVPRHLGDIVISSPTARRQASRQRHPADKEARILLIHGFLHLLGYDHETDDGEMEMLERTLRWEVFED